MEAREGRGEGGKGEVGEGGRGQAEETSRRRTHGVRGERERERLGRPCLVARSRAPPLRATPPPCCPRAPPCCPADAALVMSPQVNLYRVPADAFEWEVEEEENDGGNNLEDEDSDD